MCNCNSKIEWNNYTETRSTHLFLNLKSALTMWFNHLLLCELCGIHFLLDFVQSLGWFLFICLTSGRYLTTTAKTEETARCFIGIELCLKPNPFRSHDKWLLLDSELFIALQQPPWQYNTSHVPHNNKALLIMFLLWHAFLGLDNEMQLIVVLIYFCTWSNSTILYHSL